ncbi:hypothetical protein ACFQ4C_24335 [Larkinella insperata]|uniref:DUF4177 domain-containing protein n=1 Tax=Larkinella insperata TaxID=332158 RepID=A0ABW3QEP8_9BACT|nr:hypothetical protein [Larkinella insperata]
MKLLSALLFFCVLSFQTVAQLVVNRVDINQLDIGYCQLICEYGSLGGKARIYVDYGQANFREGTVGELRNFNSEGEPTERFDTVMQAVNFVEKQGWEVVSSQVTHAGSGSSNQFIYLMRKKRKA